MHTPARRIDTWFTHYSADHVHPLNQRLHVICVPLIVWTIIALLWCIPVPTDWPLPPGVWALATMCAVWLFYFHHSRSLGLGMLAAFTLLSTLTHLLYLQLGAATLAWVALGVFVLAWIGQFVGHHFEGRRPSFLTDLVYLLIGPIWVLAKLYRRMNWRY